MKRFNLESVHFSKDHKVKYRCHLTLGVIVGLGCCMVGNFTGIHWLIYCGELTNVATAIFWIWE